MKKLVVNFGTGRHRTWFLTLTGSPTVSDAEAAFAETETLDESISLSNRQTLELTAGF